jgi:ABC-2 type transport system permease protein
MTLPGSHVWFARHELRLAWRDMLSMMTAGRAGRERQVAWGVVIIVLILHGVAFAALRHTNTGLTANDLSTRIAVMAAIILTGSAMLSQAMENVTRTFYTRSDLELILSAPIAAERLFTVRAGATALSVSVMSLFLVGPFIDVLAFEGGVRWLAAYGVIVAVALAATALGILLTVFLFQIIGPKRTRLAAQIAAALIGGAFVIGLQLAAMFSMGSLSRTAFLQSAYLAAHVPDAASLFWWPARAALGDGVALVFVVAASGALLFAAILLCVPRFAAYAIAAAGVSERRGSRAKSSRGFRVAKAASALRRKEMLLLARDPWLISQSLMQLLYLVPPAVLLAQSFHSGNRAAIVLVPVLIMAAGQLAGGLAWLTISGEDAPDLVLTAPVAPTRLLRAKIEAVMASVGIVFSPLVAGLLFVSPALAGVAACGIVASAGSATAIQFWFRSQARRSQFRRRHTSSRIATFSEAFSSITWAAAGAIAAAGSWLAGIVALIALGILAGVRLMSPARTAARAYAGILKKSGTGRPIEAR